jgi:antitoxin CptB
MRERIAWRCRRGMRELDLMLLRWLEERYEGASPAQRAQFEALLDLPDPQLAAWLLQGVAPMAQFAALIETLRQAPAGETPPFMRP